MEWVTMQVSGFEHLHLLIRDLDALGVDAGVQHRLDPEPGPGGDSADGLDDDLAGLQRPASPVHRDVREQPVLDPIPFRSSRWQVQHGDLKPGLPRERCQFGLPQPVSASVPTFTQPVLAVTSYTPYGTALPSSLSAKSCTFTLRGSPAGSQSAPPLA